LYRAALESKNDPIAINSYRGVDNRGNALYEKKINPAVTLIERVHKALRDYGEDLIASRKAKAKLNQEHDHKKPDQIRRELEEKLKNAVIVVAANTQELSNRTSGSLPMPKIDITEVPLPPEDDE